MQASPCRGRCHQGGIHVELGSAAARAPRGGDSSLTSTSPSPRFPISPRQKPPWPSSDAQAGRYHLPVHTPPWGLADSLLPPPTSRFPLSS